VPLLVSVVVLLAFFLFLFAVAGVSWPGWLARRKH
jgi:hypothetical protein